jgi:hypothetical protein
MQANIVTVCFIVIIIIIILKMELKQLFGSRRDFSSCSKRIGLELKGSSDI